MLLLLAGESPDEGVRNFLRKRPRALAPLEPLEGVDGPVDMLLRASLKWYEVAERHSAVMLNDPEARVCVGRRECGQWRAISA